MTRLKTLIALVLFILAVAPVSAVFATAEPEPATTETTMAENTDPRMQPAVVVDDSAAPPEEEAWTFRYLVPTVLAVAAVGILLTLLVYAIRVRGRYRVVR